MITAQLMGGVGNMMFQIAAAHALALENNDTAVFDFDKHNITHKKRKAHGYQNSIFRKIVNQKIPTVSTVYREKAFAFSPIPYQPNMALYGYFQSEKYFSHCEQEIRDLFEADPESQDIINEKYGAYLRGSPRVSVHIRRGDYLTLDHIHPVCDKNYYLECFKTFGEEATYMIFSDDVPWCRENFSADNFKIIEENDIISLYLMSLCDHNIIANSSFSWWGAWLNNNNNKVVIAPKKWFGPGVSHNTNDLLPPNWRIL